MKRAMSSLTSPKRIGLRSAVLVLLAAACSTPAEEPERPPSVEDSVAAIADRLVSTAELRTDLRTLRVLIRPFGRDRAAGDAPAQVVSDPDRENRIRHALEQEFLLALANRLYVVDSEAGGSVQEPGEAGRDDAAARLGVTHLLVGDYARRGDDLLLSVRLVGADSRVILAATRGTLPVAAIGEPSLPEPDGDVASTVAVTEPLAAEAPPQRSVAQPPPARPRPEDFETWRNRRLAEEAAGTTEERVERPLAPAPLPRHSVAGSRVEDFATWRARRLAGQTAVSESAVLATTSRPWRTPELARLLHVPADPSLANAPTTTAPESDFHWRTGKLAELLRIPEASRTAETSTAIDEKSEPGGD